MAWIQADRGWIKAKTPCPACGRMNTLFVKLPRTKSKEFCECGAELVGIFHRSLEWDVRGEVANG